MNVETVNIKTSKLLPIVLLCTLGAAPLLAAAPEAQASKAQAASPDVQGDLSALLRAMERLPPGTRSSVYPADFPWKDAERLTLDPKAQEVLNTLFGPGGEAAGVPGALAVLHGGAVPAVDLLATTGRDPEAFRARLLEITATMRRLGSDLPPALAKSLDRFDRGIQALSREQMAEVMVGLSPHRPRLAAATDGIAPTFAADAMDDCTGSFPELEICQIGALFDTVSSFFTDTLPHFFTVEAPAAILGALQELINLALELIPTPEEFLGMLGLDNPDWDAIAGALPSGVFFGDPPGASSAAASAGGGMEASTDAAEGLQLPCPSEGTIIFPFGTMGDIESYYSCKRTAEWLLRALFKTSPKDGEGLAFKIAVGLVYFPTKYLCGCFEKGWFVPFWEDQLAHVADMTERMDVDLSTRAMQIDLDAAAAQRNQLETDALTGLGLSQDLDALLAALNVAGGEGDDLQAELMELRLTHLIEVDLSRQANGPAVGLFQLPAAHGGLLEKAAAIADEAIDNAVAQGGNVKNAQGSFAQAVALQAAGDFKGAYQMYRYAYQQALAAMK